MNEQEPKSLAELAPLFLQSLEQDDLTYTGFYDLDDLIGPLESGKLLIIAGRPSVGKSLLGAEIAHHVACLYKKPTLFFSLQMSASTVTQRFIAAATEIETKKLASGNISRDEMPKLEKAKQLLQKTPVLIDDTPNLGIHSIKDRIKSAISSGKDLSLVVIDCLQLIAVDGDTFWHARQLEGIVGQLKTASREFKVPIILLSGVSRKADERVNKRPTIFDLPGTGRIEEDADIVLFLYRDECYDSDTPDRGILEVNCAKHRYRSRGTVKLLFDGSRALIRNFVGRAINDAD